MNNIYGKLNPKSRMCLWIKIVTDLYYRHRGFSLLGREFVVYGSKPVKHTVICTIDKKPMEGIFYPVALQEWIRVVPEMTNSNNLSNFMFIPIEFCLKFIRPIYNKPESYKQFGLENEQWATNKKLIDTFGKYTNINAAIPEKARIAADIAYKIHNK